MEQDFDFDVVVVGSGFGGSVSALRLSEKGYRVGVFEAGRRFESGDFPKSSWDIRRFMYLPRLGLRGIQRLNLLSDVLVLSGAGVGGGSLVYANTHYEPFSGFFADKQWAHITDWRSELEPFYRQAKLMLGVTTAPTDSPSDEVIQKVGERMGVPESYKPTQVAVYLGKPGETVGDPYFGGAGPSRTGCIQCGACMVGCHHNAKNSLDRNYLHLAEGLGVDVLAERQVTDVIPLEGGGYEVVSERPGPRRGRMVQRHETEQIVFSAGVLGTVRLLADLKMRDRLPLLSDQLGRLVRTNSESILGATADKVGADYSTGLAISSSIYPNENTHIEGVRYPKGSNFMGLLAAPLVGGKGRLPRPVRFLGGIFRHPKRFFRSLSVRRWSERSVILLVMQSRDNSINLKWRKRKNGVSLKSEQGTGEPNPTYIPEAEKAACLAADVIGGNPTGSLNEALLDVPITAHILGGCVIGSDAEHGVIDPYQRMFGHPGLHVADASAISANLGVNPSLTITAQTERAMAMWPNKGQVDERPPVGESYRQLEPTLPRTESVPTDAPAALQWQ